MILTLKTDNPEAEVGLFETKKQISYYKWLADRNLARDLFTVIKDQLNNQNKDWQDISAVIVYEGPGSFTGLRIGITVANALAYGQNIPIIAASGTDWLAAGLKRLANKEDDKIVLPKYGAEANITLPKK